MFPKTMVYLISSHYDGRAGVCVCMYVCVCVCVCMYVYMHTCMRRMLISVCGVRGDNR